MATDPTIGSSADSINQKTIPPRESPEEAQLTGMSYGLGMGERSSRFGVGDCIHHARFGYRGVVFDVDATFQGTDEWYEEVARSRPPRDAPWYHVLVEDSDLPRYVAEQNLKPDPSGVAIRNPLLERYFAGFIDGRYEPLAGAN